MHACYKINQLILVNKLFDENKWNQPILVIVMIKLKFTCLKKLFSSKTIFCYLYKD